MPRFFGQADGIRFKQAVRLELCGVALIDKDMKKIDLEREAGITHYALGQLSRGKDVSTEVLGKICQTLDCSINDIMEFIQDSEASHD